MDNLVVASPGRALGMAFASGDLDRKANFREDNAAIAAYRLHPQARAAVFVREQPVLIRVGEALEALHTIPAAEKIGALKEEVYLGEGPDGAPRFARWLADDAVEMRSDASDGFLDRRELVVPGREDLKLIDLRTLAQQERFAPETLSLLAAAKAILFWHAKHGFCSNCGQPTHASAHGWRRECVACKTHHFPRTDPVVIMLVVDGDRVLLGRQARFPKGFYSALAGFVEPGETLEDAVKREVLEEANLHCADVTYLASQPWPFPASLMIGCFAKAVTREVKIDGIELEDARWFSRDEVKQMLAGSHAQGLASPGRMAIARTLLETWAQR